MSSAEAELVAGVECAKEIVWCRNILRFEQTKPTLMLMDNEAAIKIAHRGGFTSRTKVDESPIRTSYHQN